MSFNGSGAYSLPSGNPVVTGTSISSTWANSTLSDIATALTNALCKDGQSTPTANLKMGGYKFTGLGAGSASGDSVRFEQLFSQGAPIDIASAATVDIGAQNTNFLTVTGTTTITSFGTNYNGPKMLRFAGALTLTHNATTLILPGAANITTAAGDTCIAIPKSTSSGTADGWTVLAYQKASGGVGIYAVGTAANNLVQLDSSGKLPAVDGSQLTGINAKQIQSISASVGSNALTISASALSLDFRSTTLGSGTVTTVSGTPANLVISSGSTLGTTNAVQSDIAVLAINNAGTIELAAVNLAGGVDLSETGVISTTAEGGAGAADSISTIYSTTARTNVAYRVIGIVRSTQATAGTWATAPSLIQGLGGEAQAGKKLYPLGSAPVYGVRAWVNFNGTGTVAIRASGNVTSITDQNVGEYFVNFTTAMPDADYAPAIVASSNGTAAAGPNLYGQNSLPGGQIAPSTTSFRFAFYTAGGGNYDPSYISVSVVR